MSTPITITDFASNTFRVTAPDFGYKTTIHVNTRISVRDNGTFGIYDYGEANDWRSCDVTFIASTTDASNLVDTFIDIGKGRGLSFNMTLDNDSGFFPFGPDKGDSGTFQCRCLSIEDTGIDPNTWGYIMLRMVFVAESYPSYSIPAQTATDAEGPISVGTVTGLRFPDMFPRPRQDIPISTSVSIDGTPYTQHLTTLSDQFMTDVAWNLNEVNAANLLDYLLGTVRANNVDIVMPLGAFAFGVENESGGTYTCRWVDSEIDVIGDRPNGFLFNTSMYRVSGPA